jgi:hypothetical protein
MIEYRKNNLDILRVKETARYHKPGVARQHKLTTWLLRYGLTPEKYSQMLADQNNCCYACEEPFTYSSNGRGSFDIAVDHDHNHPGSHRVLMHQNCNKGFGYLRENITALKNLIKLAEMHALI